MSRTSTPQTTWIGCSTNSAAPKWLWRCKIITRVLDHLLETRLRPMRLLVPTKSMQSGRQPNVWRRDSPLPTRKRPSRRRHQRLSWLCRGRSATPIPKDSPPHKKNPTQHARLMHGDRMHLDTRPTCRPTCKSDCNGN